jgi:hypothetical protein
LAKHWHGNYTETAGVWGFFARRIDKLTALAAELGASVSVGYLDVSKRDCIEDFNAKASSLGAVDPVIISAGMGYLNPTHTNGRDEEIVAVNVTGFMTIAQAACLHFRKQGRGHWQRLRLWLPCGATARRQRTPRRRHFNRHIWMVCVNQCERRDCRLPSPNYSRGLWTLRCLKRTPLSPLVRGLLVADPSAAARQMPQAINRKEKHAYITRRYIPLAFLLKILPRPG